MSQDKDGVIKATVQSEFDCPYKGIPGGFFTAQRGDIAAWSLPLDPSLQNVLNVFILHSVPAPMN